MNWPEACTARRHVQGKRTCMETDAHTHRHAHTRAHTHVYVWARTHTHARTHTRAQQKQAIRLHYKNSNKPGRHKEPGGRAEEAGPDASLSLHAAAAEIRRPGARRGSISAHLLLHVCHVVFFSSQLPVRGEGVGGREKKGRGGSREAVKLSELWRQHKFHMRCLSKVMNAATGVGGRKRTCIR